MRCFLHVLFISILVGLSLTQINQHNDKFHPVLRRLFDQVDSADDLSFFVLLEEFSKSETSIPSTTEEREEQQIQFIYNKMNHSQHSQADLLALFDKIGITVEKSFWISNMIQVRGTKDIADYISSLSQVILLEPNENTRRLPDVFHEQVNSTIVNVCDK